jgi:O-methyltransferase
MLYLDLLKKSLLDIIYEPLTEKIEEGTVHPKRAHTMIGLKRLDNIQYCFQNILKDNIEGGLIETGVWRGGATIFMAGLVKAFGQSRKVFVADSFEGLPMPNPDLYPVDRGDQHYTYSDLSVSFDDVCNNFNKYGLLDENVIFLKGWFKDTLPLIKNEKLSLIRLDGDMYESTWQAIENLYENLSVGGYLIVDDWLLNGARKAIEDYRRIYNIDEPIEYINEHSVFWRKTN